MMQRHHPEQFMATENTETHRKNFSKSVLCSSGFPPVKICAILWLKKFPANAGYEINKFSFQSRAE
jgi:hypothetical protein